jgi:PAS domain S-box-containing protein
MPFHWIFLAFGTFIIACGATHLMEVWTIWTPVYWLAGAVKAVTALASVTTAFALPPLIPKALGVLRSSNLSEQRRQELEDLNVTLQREIRDHERAVEAFRLLNRKLEERVQQRTTELVQANARLAKKAAIIEHSSDAIYSTSLRSVITDWNPAAERIFGYAAQEIIGKSVDLLVPGERTGEFESVAKRLLAGEQVEPFETVRLRKDGGVIDVQITISTVKDEDEHAIGASAIARDITANKQAEKHMRESQKLESLGLIAGGVAHDFNNLLAGILGNASMALESLTPSHPDHILLQDVVDACAKASSLTRQLLAYAGKGQLVTEKVNLSQLVAEISRLIQASIPKAVHLRLELDHALPVVEADPGQLQQVIMNLVINGAEAIPEGQNGTVLVNTSAQEVDLAYIENNFPGQSVSVGRYVIVEVHDNGSGMDQEIQAKIFDPFFTTKFTGRGLGLAAALGIVRGHKGAIRVYSVPGKGSTFKVLLPAVPGVAEKRSIEKARGELRGTGTILVIDDEPGVRASAQRVLERYGYQTLLADDGQAGVAIFQENAHQITAVLLDMTMPLMNGEETFRRIRAIQADACVVLTSGYNEVETVRRFTAKGIAAFIQKPYTAAQLAQAMKRAIGRPT